MGAEDSCRWPYCKMEILHTFGKPSIQGCKIANSLKELQNHIMKEKHATNQNQT